MSQTFGARCARGVEFRAQVKCCAKTVAKPTKHSRKQPFCLLMPTDVHTQARCQSLVCRFCSDCRVGTQVHAVTNHEVYINVNDLFDELLWLLVFTLPDITQSSSTGEMSPASSSSTSFTHLRHGKPSPMPLQNWALRFNIIIWRAGVVCR